MLITIGAALLAFSLALIVYRLIKKPTTSTTYRGSEVVEINPTELPDFIDRTIGNVTGWRITRRVTGFEDKAVIRAMEQSGNPWGITLTQYYALVVLAALAFGAGFAVIMGLLGGVIGGLLGIFSITPIVVLVGFILGAITGSRLPLSMMRARANTKQRHITTHLDEAMDLFSMGTSTGSSIPDAMAMTRRYLLEGDLQSEVSRVVDDLNQNMSFSEAIDGFYTRTPTKRVKTFVRVLKAANADGVDRTDTLRREAAEIRQDQQRLMEKRSGLVQMIFITSIIVGLLPLLLIPFVVPFAQAILDGGGLLG